MPLNIIRSGGNGKLVGYIRPPPPDSVIFNNYISNIEAADGQSLELSTKNAIQDFIFGCVSDGILNQMEACCILGGARTLNGALIPLKGVAPTNNNFVSSDYSRSIGLKGNLTSKCLNTNYFLTSSHINDCHGAVFTTQNPGAGNRTLFGMNSSNNTTLRLMTASSTNRNYDYCINNIGASIVFGSATVANTLQGLSIFEGMVTFRRNQEDYIAYNGGYGTDTTRSVLIFARRNSSNVNSDFFDGRIFFYSIGKNIDLTKLNNRLNTLFNAFSSLT